MTTYSSIPLFGGALTVDLPTTFADVSTIRQVPDHQEVYLDKDGFTSIIFDITERVGTAGSSPATDGAAMTAHLEDIVDSDLDSVKVWSITDTQFSKLPEGTPAYTLIATQTPPHDPDPQASAPDFTAIVLNLVRLERESTDILVTINVPHIQGEYSADDVDLQLGKQGKLIENAVEHAAKIWETFHIKDWGLFDEV
ncbi:putative ran guanine nucleotide release factor [Sclerotinia borealis F-4128]|uniref:Putative ran guanine nucleotide release factor n=1 Tax=Sclerotinia borealis (strain F-4128) TaxID=1432307 RepID=W9CQ76_SCLBF|nr:putative ran guanine nucleotide release factor [Sclerotinia borealis F-4128]